MKDQDVNNVRGNITIRICATIHKLFPGEIIGAQKINNIWLLYLRTERTRAALIVNGFDFEGQHIDVYDDNPLKAEGKKSERIVIKDLPATIPPHIIMAFLQGYPQLKTRSKVIYAKERMGGEEMSQFINGDRLIYVNPNVSPPLPKETVINGHPCRIWHASQKNYCKRCANHGHRTNDVDMCESYDPDCTVVAFRADSNPLSNYYKCTLIYEDKHFMSSEHLYQYAFCMHCDRPDMAQQVFEAPTPKRAKEISTHLKSLVNKECLANWGTIKLSVMKFVLGLKWNSCAKFRQTLLSTNGQTIAEATQDAFWGVAAAPNLAQFTKPNKFLGRNQLGQLLMTLRDAILRDDLLTKKGDMILPSLPLLARAIDNEIKDNIHDSDAILNLSDTSPPVDDPTETVSDPLLPETTPAQLITVTAPTTMSSETAHIEVIQSNSTSTTEHSTPTKPPPRKTKGKQSDGQVVAKHVNTIDKYIKRDSPATKRKLSNDTVSPSSAHVDKTTRTDGADVTS